MLAYTPGPTGARFLASRAFLKLILGPVGGGKSTVAFFDLLARSFAQKPFNGVRRTKHIVLRNTMQQLKSTVKPLIDQWMVTMPPSPMGQWRITDNTFEIKVRIPDGTVVHTEFLLMPADTPDDVRRLLSVECSSAWVEEAREVDPEVFAGLQGRVARFPNRASGGVTYPGVICSTNPPPLGGFWHEFITQPASNTEIFVQPSALLPDGTINPEAENLANLDPDYYDNLIAANTDGWIDVYLRNNFGPGNMGQPVFKASFKRDFHVAKKPLLAVSQGAAPLVVGMDNGLQAAAVVLQRDMRGRVNGLTSAYVPEDKTMGVESFLDKILIPHLTAKFPLFRKESFVFVLDPACFQRSQVDEKTIAMAVAARGYNVVKASTNDPERRVQAVEALLTLQIDGEAGMLFDPEGNEHLLQAMEWGYRYKKSKDGSVQLAFDKNHHSHIAEALEYAALHYNQAAFGAGFARKVAARPVVKKPWVYA